MQKTGMKTLGGVNAGLGLLGIVVGLVVIGLAIGGLMLTSSGVLEKLGESEMDAGFDIGRMPLFFGLAIAHGVIIGLIVSSVLFASGLGLIQARKWARSTAFGYLGAKLILGFLTLAAVIVFFSGLGSVKEFSDAMVVVADPASAQPAEWQAEHQALQASIDKLCAPPNMMVRDDVILDLDAQLRKIKVLGWGAEIILLLSLIPGFCLALAQLTLMWGGNGASGGGTETGIMPPKPLITGFDPEVQKTLVQHSKSPTITVQVYQNERVKESRQFELLTADGATNKVIIGRDSGCDVAIRSDPSVSAEHCALQCDASGLICVTDLASANGTFLKRGLVNPQRIFSRTHLEDGDTLIMGAKGRTQVRIYFNRAESRVISFKN